MNELELVRHELEKVELPDDASLFRIDLGEDAQGDPAVWIWIAVPDSVWSEDWLHQHTGKTRTAIREALSQSGSPLWPYVRFILESDRAVVGSAQQ